MSTPVSCEESRGKNQLSLKLHFTTHTYTTTSDEHIRSWRGSGHKGDRPIRMIPTIPLVSIIPSLSWAPQRGRMGRGASRSVNGDDLLALTPFKWRPIIQVSLSLSFSNARWRKRHVGKGAKEWIFATPKQRGDMTKELPLGLTQTSLWNCFTE